MDHFNYLNGQLYAEEVAVSEIADAVGTPFYLYSTATLLRHYGLVTTALDGLDHLVCYAVKAASNQAILRTLVNAGAGMDVVSAGEYLRAQAAGVASQKIVFSGVGKTAAEIATALDGGLRQFNVESEPELELISTIAASKGLTVPITIRVNPDVDAKTHAKISTGKAENKFGVPISQSREVYARAAKMPGLKIVGVDVHIGSQLTDLAPFEKAYRKVSELTGVLRSDGHEITRLDLGGGLGIPYAPSDEAPPHPSEYGKLIKDIFKRLNCEIQVEPGRLIVGNAAILVASVISCKSTDAKNFLVLDAAMNDFLRPAMYNAWHEIIPIQQPEEHAEEIRYDVVGPVCETSDSFACDRVLPSLCSGDLVAFRSTGAYGAVMASEYNSRPLIPEVLVNGKNYAVVRPRPSIEDMIDRDIIPQWLCSSSSD
ncbi:MAG: diaminopimelate decarboxylase [Aestuariivita sp.]|nr:diaminopimelate decarboxylase [Aestuariivita sp.]MCY4346930.1 diaminopimelate decarboxylase [Aestuariivita sp.]